MGSQVNHLSSGSQKLSDIGYSSGLSKDFQSPNLPAGGASLSTCQSSLELKTKVKVPFNCVGVSVSNG